MNLIETLKDIAANNKPSMISETNRRLLDVVARLEHEGYVIDLMDLPTPVKRIWRCEDGEYHWFVAYSEDECRRYWDEYVFQEHGVNRMEQEENGMDAEILPMNATENFSYHDFDGTSETVTKTIAEWLADDPPCGFFASSVY